MQASSFVYALSKKGVVPSAYLTWFQATAACLASGKRLPNGREWLLAAMGTIDPGSSPGTNGRCVTETAGGPRATGAVNANVNCASLWGAQDMIGNVWEWIDEWYAGPGGTTGMPNWPDATYNGDGTWNTSMVGSLPAAAIRGGGWGTGTLAGVFALELDYAPSTMSATVGFRCLLPN